MKEALAAKADKTQSLTLIDAGRLQFSGRTAPLPIAQKWMSRSVMCLTEKPTLHSLARLEEGDSYDVTTDKSEDSKPRQRIRSRSEDQLQNQHARRHRRRRRTSENHTTTTMKLLVGSLLVVVLVTLLSVGDIRDLIYPPQSELRRRLAEATSSDSTATSTKLHLDERYAFDGTHSDFAQQFYRRYLAGDDAQAIKDTSVPTEVIDYVNAFGLDFAALPAMLQQAVVWDLGYVAAADLGYVKVYTKCGMRMSELQISLSAYRTAGCTEQRCSSPNGDPFSQSLYCSGYQMGNVSLCAATNGITPVHGAMWADGGTDDVVPVGEMQRHEWTDSDIDYTIMAIHLSGDPNSYGKCVMPSMIVPCVAYDARTADELDWCSPEHGEIVPQWLELEKTGGVFATESSGWQKAAPPVAITSLVLLILVLVSAFVFWRRTRDQQQQTQGLVEHKRAILGDRGSDQFSMMDDIDFILEAPDRDQQAAGWVAWGAWGHTPVKPKPAIKPSVVGESRDDLDDVHDSDNIYRHDYRAHRSPSKASTAAMTSFASSSPRNTFTRQSSSTECSSAPTDHSSGPMVSPLVAFQTDPAVTARRVPYVDVSIVRQLTTGAYGEVWLGRMRGEVVAVKRLTRDRCRQLHEIEAFAAEVKLMASFAHRNVLGLLGVAWSTLEKLVLIMEYMHRGDLQHVLQYHSGNDQQTDEFSWASHKARIARDIACGLGYLHSLKPLVVHRDVKSKNVLLDGNYEAKLSDFGVSRLRRGQETMTSGMGTAYWTAPEVLAGHKYSEKADVYSLGVVLTELDTGELPFYDARTSEGDRMEAIHVLSLVASGEMQPSFTLDCPDGIRELALACLNPKPEGRPSAKEVCLELKRLLESEDTSPPVGSV